jgi:FKBP-type peptidyl-prolyl cis-trans isomerase SlyD
LIYPVNFIAVRQMENNLNTPKKPAVVVDDVVVTLEYKLTVDGELVDSSEESGPVEFIQGHDNIVPGLERVLYNLKVGDQQKVTISAEEGYGPIDPEAFMMVPRSEIPEDIPMEKGVELEIQNDDGEFTVAVIEEVTRDSVKLNFNHPLAGKELHFDVNIVDIREATPEELEHGHVHGEDFEEGEEVFYEDMEIEDSDEDDEDEPNLNGKSK